MVPWDDDIDIGILEDDLDKLLELNDELKEHGYEIVKKWELYKFRMVDKEYPFIDIFVFKKEDDKYRMSSDELNDFWPNEYFYEDECFEYDRDNLEEFLNHIKNVFCLYVLQNVVSKQLLVFLPWTLFNLIKNFNNVLLLLLQH
jgi:phosphorylcholine metabolism protein LicD